jgi:hypothetical protein
VLLYCAETGPLLSLRRKSPALKGGSHESQDVAEGLFVHERRTESDRLLIVLNSTDEERVLFTGRGQILPSTELDREGPINERLILRPNEGVILDTLSGDRQ